MPRHATSVLGRRARSSLPRWLLALFVAAITTTALGVGRSNAATAYPVGPDVSRYQHPNGAAIDWSTVLGAGGQSFGIVKATEDADLTSPTFTQDWPKLQAMRAIRGAYHFARPSSAAGDAVAEARHFVAVAGTMSQPGELPPILDLEVTGGLAPAALASWVRSWLTEVQRLTARRPMIYVSPGWWDSHVNSEQFGSYPLQVADYTSNAAPRLPHGWSTWTFWQYTPSARVPGIPAATDHNRFHGNLAQLRGLARLADGGWSGWQSLGGSLTSGPSVVNRWGANLDVFANGADHSTWTREWTGSAWTGWKRVGNPLVQTSDPAAVSWSTARIDVFGRGTDGRIWHTNSNDAGNSYTPWQMLPGSPLIDGSPAAVSWAANRLDLVVREQNSKNILHAYLTDSTWSDWENLGNTATSGPAVTSWGPGRLDVFTRAGSNNNLIHRAFSDGTWKPWENLGGNLTSDPDAVSATTNTIDITARGADNSAWHMTWTTTHWSDWEKIGGSLTSTPAIGTRNGTYLDVFARGADNQLWHTWHQ